MTPIDQAGSALIDYGLLGIILIGVAYFAWSLHRTQQKYADEWRKEASESSKAVIELSGRQIGIQEKQSEIQEKQNLQTKEFYDSLGKQVDELPSKIRREIEYAEMKKMHGVRTTPAPDSRR